MVPDIDPSAFELFAFAGVFDGFDGAQIAVRIKEELVFADVDAEPLGVEAGDQVVAYVVRMNSHGWFKCFHLARSAK